MCVLAKSWKVTCARNVSEKEKEKEGDGEKLASGREVKLLAIRCIFCALTSKMYEKTCKDI